MRARGSPNPVRRLAQMRDADLAALAAGGDRDAYGELARRHSRFVRDLMRRMGADPASADDLTQDAFLEAMRSLPGYRHEAPFTAWIRTVAARLFLKRKYQQARQVLLADPIDPQEADTVPDLDARMDLDAALRTLSPGQRTCVTLCHGAGLTCQEIANALGVPLGTVKSHVTRGLTHLRRRLDLEKEDKV